MGVTLNAYLNVGLYVSSYDIYFEPFVQHLSLNKLRHLDINTRTRAASAMGLMVPLRPELFIK